MAEKKWTLTDIDREIYTDQLVLGPDDVAETPDGWRVVKQTLRGGLRDNVDVVAIQNGALQLVVVPTRGMGLWRGKCEHLEIGWQSPVRGPVHPQFVPLAQPDGLGWLAGFDELLCRCGIESNGAPEFDEQGRLMHGLHGRIANLPASQVEVAIDAAAGEIRLSGIVDEARLFGAKLRLITTYATRFGSKQITIRDQIVNLSAEPVDAMLLYHVNFGPPLLVPGSRAVIPIKTMAPVNSRAAEGIDRWDVYEDGQPGFVEQCYFFQLASDPSGNTRVMLRDEEGHAAVSLCFNVQQLPCFTIWKNTQMPPDGYVTGLEPGINFPTTRSFETQHGRGRHLEGGQQLDLNLTIQVHTDARSVAEAEAEIQRLQQAVAPTIHRQPIPEWSPAD